MNPLSNNLHYLAAFLGGIAISFTPCLYPLIPVSAGYIGARSGGSRLRGFLLSLIYVTGIAFTYCILGLIASLTGTFFGRISVNPVTYFVVGAIIIIFGLSMLGLFNLPLVRLIKPSPIKKEGYFSTFLLGLTSGLAISPCLSPVLGSILAYLTTKNNILYGTTLLLCFAYGMGLLLILTGTFSSILVALPKSGKWLTYMERLGALVLLAMGVYFIFLGIGRL